MDKADCKHNFDNPPDIFDNSARCKQCWELWWVAKLEADYRFTSNLEKEIELGLHDT